MSQNQTKVSEFFVKRKKCDGLQPSKRRKVLTTESNVISQMKSPPIGARTRGRRGKILNAEAEPNLNVQVQNTKTIRAVKSKTTIPVLPANQKTIADVLRGVSDKLNTDACEKQINAIPTAACDNHNASPPSSPTKRRQTTQTEEIMQTTKKRSRCKNVVRKDLFLEQTTQGFMFEKEVIKKEERKVVSPKRHSTEGETANAVVFRFKGNEKDSVTEARILKLAEVAFPQAVKTTMSEPQETTKSEPIRSKVKSSKAKMQTKETNVKVSESTMEKLKLQSTKAVKKDATAMKAKLSQCSKLSDLKEKLKMLKQASPKKKIQETVKISSPVKSRSLFDAVKEGQAKHASTEIARPAYERFSSLAIPIPPGLTLPKHFKLLNDMFISADTIVSILHKRPEICTFSKLKAAVQDMTRKNFELKNLGQIKTVYPTAYIFKQEKNLPCYGKKKSNEFQLTVEVNIVDDPLSQSPVLSLTKDGRPDISVAKLMERKTVFHRKLVNIVRRHHRAFLSSLVKPITIPDEKVTKWHPMFRLDETPDIVIGELPTPQNIHVITTAKEALEHAKEKFNNPRVMQALEKVVAKNAENEKNIAKGESPKPNTSIKCNTPVKNKTPIQSTEKPSSSGTAYQSLLEKIRAKEARKQEEAMLRTPADEKKKERMGRLPELARILRTLFVTSKKPAMMKADVIDKLSDSYKSCMGQVEAESHLKLLTEVVPEWVSIVTIKRGVFVTLNKNKDVNAVIELIEKQRKQLP